jgi:hypothetical protein
MKVFSASKFGTLSNTTTPTVINMNDTLHDMGFSNDLTVQNPTAFYDKKDKRFVVTWGTAYATPQSNNGEVPAPLLVCVSCKYDNPLLDWTCWALDATLESQPSVPFCTDNALFSYVPDYAQCKCQPTLCDPPCFVCDSVLLLAPTVATAADTLQHVACGATRLSLFMRMQLDEL